MGLKKRNYTIKTNGVSLPEAYACIKNIQIFGERGRAEIYVQASRDNAISLAPLEVVTIMFDVDRNESPYVTAYNKAKSIVTREVEGKTLTHEMPFYGWEDDIAKV